MKLLIVVDMQNDFIDGALGTKEAVGIVDKVKDKIFEYKCNHNPIIFTRDTHKKSYLDTQEGKNLPVEHCIYSTHGWEITDKLDVRFCQILNKSSFGSIYLAEYIEDVYKDKDSSLIIDEIELVGLCTDICVISNAMILKAKFPETLITVDASCCAGVTPESHRNALAAMKMCQINVVNG